MRGGAASRIPLAPIRSMIIALTRSWTQAYLPFWEGCQDEITNLCGGNTCFSFNMEGLDQRSLEGFCATTVAADDDSTAEEQAADAAREQAGCAWDSMMQVALDCDGQVHLQCAMDKSIS